MIRTLRPYQANDIDSLCKMIAEGHSRIVFQGPTGSGKSTSVVFLMSKILGTRDFSKAVVAVPQEQIKGSFLKVRGEYVYPAVPAADGVVTYGSQLVGNRVDVEGGRPKPVTWWRKQVEGEKQAAQLLTHLKSRLANDNNRAHIVTHATLRNVADEIREMDLSGALLIIDEAHHANINDPRTEDDQTRLGRVADVWVEKGGVVIYVTATPFRSTQSRVVPPGTPRVSRSMITHAREGYAPAEFRIKVVLTGRPDDGEIGHVIHGTSATAQEAYVEEWVAQDRPFTIMLVPPGNSEAWANELETLLVTERARVLNAVGEGDVKKRALLDALQEYDDLQERCREAGRRVRVDEVPYQVILAAMRFNEGTDYPPASLIFSPTIPRSFPLSIQRLGRTTRSKRADDGTLLIEGYKPEHADAASMTFFVFKEP